LRIEHPFEIIVTIHATRNTLDPRLILQRSISKSSSLSGSGSAKYMAVWAMGTNMAWLLGIGLRTLQRKLKEYGEIKARMDDDPED